MLIILLAHIKVLPLTLFLQKKEEEYQLKKQEAAATKIQKFYKGFRYNVMTIAIGNVNCFFKDVYSKCSD